MTRRCMKILFVFASLFFETKVNLFKQNDDLECHVKMKKKYFEYFAAFYLLIHGNVFVKIYELFLLYDFESYFIPDD